MKTTMDSQPTSDIRLLESSPTSLRSVYIERLERLLRLRQEHEEELNSQGLRLLDRAIFAAYCACRDVGSAAAARAVLQRADVTIEEPAEQLELPRTGTDG